MASTPKAPNQFGLLPTSVLTPESVTFNKTLVATNSGNKIFPRLAKIRRILPLSVILLSSCGVQDIASVQQFANLAHQANEKYPVLVADFYGSCVRAFEFQADTLPSRQEIEVRCGSYQELQPGLLEINQVLESYVFALGSLASNQTVIFDSEFYRLGSAVRSLPHIQPQQVDAVTKLANFLVSAGVEGYRREELGDVIGLSNNDFQVTLSTLKNIFESDYNRLLQLESDAMDSFYREKIEELKNNPEELLRVRQQWQEKKELINQKLSAVNDYLQILDQVGQAHQELYDQRNHLDAATVNQLMLQYSYRLKPLIENLVKTFS